MPKIAEDKELKNQFIKQLQERCAPARTEIHVTDLTWCLRKAYYRRYQNRHLTDNQLLFFLEGHQRHEGIQSLLGQVTEQEITRYGVTGHLDITDENQQPIEIKTTRSQPGKRINENIIRQLAYYCLLTGTQSCSLITQYINDQLITFERLDFSKPELDQYLQDMLEARDQLQAAYDAQCMLQLPRAEEWKCRNCEYQQNCGGINKEATKNVRM